MLELSPDLRIGHITFEIVRIAISYLVLDLLAYASISFFFFFFFSFFSFFSLPPPISVSWRRKVVQSIRTSSTSHNTSFSA